MSIDQLRRELSELVDTVPAPDIPRDTWDRARRSLVRDRIAGAVAVLAVAGGVVLGGTPFVRTTSPEEGPFALPATLSTAGDQDLPVENDLAVGTSAAAYPVQAADGSLHVVVVSASDDTHHELALPDLPAADNRIALSFGQPIRLSPDGRQLAYVTASGDDTAEATGVTGVTVLDLRTGALRSTPLPEPLGAVALTWSPAGRYLTWYGSRIVGSELAGSRAGLIGPEGASTALSKAVGELAPGDDGTVAILGANGPVRIWKNGNTVDRLDDGPTGRVISAELDGGVVSEVRSTFTATDDDVVNNTVFVRHGTHPDSGALPADFQAAHPYGWTTRGATLAASAEHSGPTHVSRLALDHGKVTVETVMTLKVHSSILTLATALPIDGAPEEGPQQLVWPWLVGGGALVLLAAGLLLLRLRSAWQVRRDLRLA